jgi:hypothetical protein
MSSNDSIPLAKAIDSLLNGTGPNLCLHNSTSKKKKKSQHPIFCAVFRARLYLSAACSQQQFVNGGLTRADNF